MLYVLAESASDGGEVERTTAAVAMAVSVVVKLVTGDLEMEQQGTCGGLFEAGVWGRFVEVDVEVDTSADAENVVAMRGGC